MKRKCLYFLFSITVLFYWHCPLVHAQITFQKTVDIKKFEENISLHQRSDTMYVFRDPLFDSIDDPNANQFFIMDTNGIVQQIKQYSHTYSGGGGWLLCPTKDKGYVFADGCMYDTSNSYIDIALLKINSNGNPLWGKKYFNIGTMPLRIKEDNFGNLVTIGIAPGVGGMYNDFFLSKFNSNGNLQWAKTYGGTAVEEGYDVMPTLDGGYAITGRTASFGVGASDYFLIKADSDGNLQWAKTFGGTGDDQACYLDQLSDGGYIIAGWTTGFGAGSYDYLVVRTDSNGNLQWAKTYGGTGLEFFYFYNQFAKTTDGKYVLPAYSGSYSPSTDFLLIEIDSTGNLYWAKTYGTSNGDEYPSVYQSNDGGFIVMGYTWNASNGTDIFMVKTDEHGNNRCNQQDVNITVLNAPVIVTSPSVTVTIVPNVQDTLTTLVTTVVFNQTTLCYCNITASFTYTINNSQITCGNTSQNSTSWLWSFGDGDTSILQNPVHTYSVNGSYVVCLTASDSLGCSDSTCYTLNINTSVSEIENGNLSMSVYPNPATENFTVEAEIKKTGDITVIVSNLLGETVQEINERAGAGKYKKTMSAEKIAKGIYFLRVKTKEGTGVRKIVIQ